MSSHCLLASMVSNKKLVIFLFVNFLYMMTPFSLAARNFLFFLTPDLLTMCADVGVFEFILLGVLCHSCMCRLMFLIKFGEVSIIFSNILSVLSVSPLLLG